VTPNLRNSSVVREKTRFARRRKKEVYGMVSFALAQELKLAGFTQSSAPEAVYALSDHLRVRREHAVQMWYGSKSKAGLPVQLEDEAVYTPTLSDLLIACGHPLSLACEEAGNWQASTSLPVGRLVEKGGTAEEALGRLWLQMRRAT
jgi:hypothetical protein